MMNFYLLANAAVKLAYPAFSHNDYAIRYPHSDDLSHTVTNHPTTFEQIRFGFKSALRNAVSTSRPMSILKQNVRNIITNKPWTLNSKHTTKYTPVMAQVKELSHAFQPGRPWNGEELRAQLAPFVVQRHSIRSPLSQCWTLNPTPGLKEYKHPPQPGYPTFGVPFILTQGIAGLQTIMQHISSVFNIDTYRYLKEIASRTLRMQPKPELSSTERMIMTMDVFLDYARANADTLEEIDVEIVPDIIPTTANQNDLAVDLKCLTSLKIESSTSNDRLWALKMDNLLSLDITISGHQWTSIPDLQLRWDKLDYVILHCDATTEKLLEILNLVKPNVDFEWDGRLPLDEPPLSHIPALTIESVDIRCPDNCQVLMDVLMQTEKVREVTLNGKSVKVPASPV